MRFTWIVKSRFVGEFDSPLSFKLNRRYYCLECGEVYATILSEAARYWHFNPGHCGCVAVPVSDPYFSESFLRCPLEQSEGFSPKEILAEEFLISFDRYPKDSIWQM